MRNEGDRKFALPLAALSGLCLAGIAYACARIFAVDAALARDFEISRREDAALSLRLDGMSSALDGAARSFEDGLLENASRNGRSLDRNAADTRKALAALGNKLDLAVSGLALASSANREMGAENPSLAAYAADYRAIADNAEAGALYEKGEYLAAAEKYRAVAEALPRDARARLFIAACLYRSGRRTLDDLDEMKRCLAASESARGEDPLALEIKAGLLAEEGAWTDACRAYEKLEAGYGLGEDNARKAVNLRLYGTALLNDGRAREAALRFDGASAAAPGNADLLFLAGEAYSRAGESGTAAERYAASFALDGRDR